MPAMPLITWSIIGVRKGPGIIPDEVRNELILQAGRLMSKEVDGMSFETEGTLGIIATKRKTVALGALSGIQFTVECSDRSGNKYEVDFFVKGRTIEALADLYRQAAAEGREDIGIRFVSIRETERSAFNPLPLTPLTDPASVTN